MCDPMAVIMGIGSILGAISNKPPKPPEPPKPALPTAPGRAQTTTKENVNVELGGARKGDKVRRGQIDLIGRQTSGNSLRTSKKSGINIL